MEMAFEAEAFDGQNISRVALDPEDQAREHRFAFEKNGASTALAEFAAVFGAGVAEIFAKNFKQSFVGGERDVDVFPVQGNSNVSRFLGFGWKCDQHKSPLGKSRGMQIPGAWRKLVERA